MKARRICFVAFAILIVLLSAIATKTQVSDDISAAMIAKDQNSYQFYLEFLKHFPNDLYAVLAFKGIVCTKEGWSVLSDADSFALQKSTVDKTISLASTNTKYVYEQNEELFVDSFTDIYTYSASDRCEKAASYKPYRNSLINADKSVALLVVIAKEGVTAIEFANSIRDIRENFSDRVSELGGEIWISGDAVMSSEISNTLNADLSLILVLLFLMLVCVQITIRSVRVTVAAFVTVVFSIIGALGTAVALGLAITPGSALAIFLLAPLSTAFVIHASAYRSRSEEPELIPPDSIFPILFAGLTTAALFGATGLTISPDVQSLAIVGVSGILWATLSIFIFVFPLLHSSTTLYPVAVTIPRWAFVNPWISYFILGVLVLWVSIGLTTLRFEYEAIDYLPEQHQQRIEFEKIGAEFGRMTIPLVISMENLNDVEKWKRLEKLVSQLESKENPIHVDWLYEHISQLFVLFKEDEDSSVFPDSPQVFDQLYLWIEHEDLDHLIGADEDRITIMLNVPYIGSAEHYELKEEIDSFLDAEGMDGRLTGRVSAFFETGHQVGIDNLISLAGATVVIWIVLVLLFRSLLLASIIILINAIPALSALASLGIAGIPIDLGSSIVTAIAFGIVVDDSTHLIVRIRRLQRSGYDPSTAVVRAVRELAGPILFTSITLSIGFAVLFAAEMRPFQDFAATILISLGTALVADLIILPTLVRTFLKDPLEIAYS